MLVATVRALKSHGGVPKAELDRPDPRALAAGLENLGKHIENLTKVYSLPVAVAINRFASDTPEEIAQVQQYCMRAGVKAVEADVWGRGGKGAAELAQTVTELCRAAHAAPTFAYSPDMSLREKIEAVATRIYGADGVDFSPAALVQLENLEKLGCASLPVCIAKTQYSLSDNPRLSARPRGFSIKVSQLRLSAGAGFTVVLTGDIMTMPGLPRVPAACKIDVTPEGKITGLF